MPLEPRSLLPCHQVEDALPLPVELPEPEPLPPHQLKRRKKKKPNKLIWEIFSEMKKKTTEQSVAKRAVHGALVERILQEEPKNQIAVLRTKAKHYTSL